MIQREKTEYRRNRRNKGIWRYWIPSDAFFFLWVLYPNAKAHGVTKAEAAAIITHAAFYAGWPKGWVVFGLAKDVWKDETAGEDAKAAHAAEMVFPVGKPNDGFAQYFTGRSFLAPLSTSQVGIFNVTFEPGCRNNWIAGDERFGGT